MGSTPDQLASVTRRMSAGKMLLAGASSAHVCATLGICRKTVRKYKRCIEDGGLEALRNMRVGGRPTRLTAETLRWLRAILLQPPELHGFEGNWTNERLRDAIEQRVGYRYSRVYIRAIVSEMGLLHAISAPPEKGRKKRQAKLNSQARDWLREAVMQPPQSFGFDSERWNNARLRMLIERQFGVLYSPMYVWQLANSLGICELMTQMRK
jgi:transposase